MSSNSKTTVDAMKESEVYDYSFPIGSTEQKECKEEAHKIRNALDYYEKVLLLATLDHIMERISSCNCSYTQKRITAILKGHVSRFGTG